MDKSHSCKSCFVLFNVPKHLEKTENAIKIIFIIMNLNHRSNLKKQIRHTLQYWPLLGQKLPSITHAVRAFFSGPRKNLNVEANKSFVLEKTTRPVLRAGRRSETKPNQ